MTVERPNTLAGLVEKRAEIPGRIAHTRAILRQLIIDLDHVDAAIRIFDPGYDVEGIRQKLPTAAHRALRGDLTRATLDALRGAPGPTTTKELARHVIMAERGLNTADAALLQLFTRRTGALLRWQRKARHPAITQGRTVRAIRPMGNRRLIPFLLWVSLRIDFDLGYRHLMGRRFSL